MAAKDDNPAIRLLGWTFLGIVLTVGLFVWRACEPAKPLDKEPAYQTTVYLGWLFSGAYSGEALGSKVYAPMENLKVDLEPGGPGLDPLRLVKDGTFGVASADEVIRLIDRGSDLVIVGVLNDRAPAAFAVLSTSKIMTPQDFIGKRVGMLPFGSTGLIYQSLMKKLHIDRTKVKEVQISPDLRPFVTGATHDVQPVYTYDEPVSFDQQNISYRLIRPEEFGVEYKGPVYFTTRNTVKQQPAMVKRFIVAMIKGWDTAASYPDSAIQALAGFEPRIDKRREREVLQRALPYYLGKERRPLTSAIDSWTPMVDDLQEFGVIEHRVAPSSFVDLSFVNAAYQDEH